MKVKKFQRASLPSSSAFEQ